MTGLQTFMLHGSFSHATLSDWGWHSAANPEITLWDRTHLLDGWMEWMRGPGLESARRQAARQGCQGVRWMKMIAWTAEWESPSDAGPFRMMI